MMNRKTIAEITTKDIQDTGGLYAMHKEGYFRKRAMNLKKRINIREIFLSVLIIISLTSCHNKKTNTTKDIECMNTSEKQLIETLLNNYQKSLNTSDAKLAQSLYTKDGIFMPTEAPSGIGAEEILKSYEYVFSQIQLNISFSIEEIKVDKNLAYAVTSSKGTTLIHATGDTIPEANRELFVFEKENRSWKIARYMFNKTEPKQ